MTAFLEAIDNRTLLVATALVTGAFAPLMLLIRRSHRTYPGFGQWAAALYFLSLAALMHSLRGFVDNFFPVILGNSCLFAGMLLYAQGVRLFCGLSWHGRLFGGALGASIAGIAWFYFVHPDELVRVSIITVFQSVAMYFGGISLLRSAPPERRFSHRFAAFAFIITGSTIFLRVFALFWMPRQNMALSSTTPNTIYYSVMLLGSIAIIFGFFLLTYERLVADLRIAHDSLAAETFERIRVEKRLADARQLELVGRLAGGVAHFFNNKLCVMNGYAALLQESGASTPSMRTMSRFIEDAGKQMAAMTDRLLAFSRSKMLRNADVDLSGWLRGVEPQIRNVFGDSVSVTIDTPSAPVMAHVEADELSRVILRMAHNSREAMPRGGSFSIRLSQVQVQPLQRVRELEIKPGSYACLSLTDTGIGMSDETRMRVFEPFFSTKGLANAEGLGLGSAFGFVAQSGGTITVQSDPGEGATFDIYLPLKTVPEDVESAEQYSLPK